MSHGLSPFMLSLFRPRPFYFPYLCNLWNLWSGPSGLTLAVPSDPGHGVARVDDALAHSASSRSTASC